MKKNKFNISYWMRKIYTSKFFQLLPLNKTKLKKKYSHQFMSQNIGYTIETTLKISLFLFLDLVPI